MPLKLFEELGKLPIMAFWLRKKRADISSAAMGLYDKTNAILLAFALLSTAINLFGHPISCMDGDDVVDKGQYLSDYCWYAGTDIADTTEGHHDPKYLAAPGLRFELLDRQRQENEERMKAPLKHRYYQWLPVALVLQAFVFRCPSYLWKRWEGERVERSVKLAQDDNGDGVGNGDDKARPDRHDDERDHAGTARLGRRLARGVGSSHGYAAKYFLAEILGAVNAITELIMTDWLLEGRFADLGLQLLRGTPNHLDTVFPKKTRCSFVYFGPGGNLVNRETLCILPLNVVHEKIYAFLWFWLILVAAFAALHVLLLVVYAASSFPRSVTLRTLSPDSPPDDINMVRHFTAYSDWLYVRLVLLNVRDDGHEEDGSRAAILRAMAAELRRLHQQMGNGVSAATAAAAGHHDLSHGQRQQQQLRCRVDGGGDAGGGRPTTPFRTQV